MQTVIDLLEQSNTKTVITGADGQPRGVLLTWSEYQKLISDKQPQKTILVTGGAGYIGGHTVQQLIKENYKVVVLDDLSSGSLDNIHPEAEFIHGDFADIELLREIFSGTEIEAVMHFAASIEVGESVEKPLHYLDNNTLKTGKLLQVMNEFDIDKFIFSSTAAVYGLQEQMPVSENAPLSPIDPYGHSKMLSEQLLAFHSQHNGLRAIVFRYFNACGANPENPVYSAHESHLIPRVVDVAMGRRDSIQIYGDDYHTADGTGVRDYVHVVDIARAHIAGLKRLQTQTGFAVYNIGTGKGLSVREIISEVQRATGREVKYQVVPRRPGDSPITVADNIKITTELYFQLQHSDLANIIKTSLR